MTAGPSQQSNWEPRAFIKKAHPRPTDQWMRSGAVAGLVAGAQFVLFKMLAALIMDENLLIPVQRISTLALGPEAAEPGYSVTVAVLIGVFMHTVLAVLYGVCFAAVMGSIRAVRSRPWVIVFAGFVLGVLLWIVNLYLIGPILFPWFGTGNPVVELTARTLFFGIPLGMWVAARPAPDAA